MSKRVYLDHNASSPLRPEAREAVARVLAMPGNPSSIHAEGRALRAEIERARKDVAALVGARAEQVFFTSGATEAANWALRGAGVRAGATEHPCVLENGAGDPLPVDGHGLVSENPAGAAVQLANSETGVVQRPDGAALCDAVQAAGRVPIDLPALGARALMLSAHKLGGPRGVGALVLADPDAAPPSLLRGGGQERRQRAGTPDAAAIAGFGAAAHAAKRDLDSMPRLAAMRDRLEDGLARLSRTHGATLHVFGAGTERLANTSCFAVEGLDAQTALMALDLDGIAVSSGSACSSGTVGASHVLAAMGVPAPVAACALRVSLGWSSADADIAAFLAAYERIVARAMKRAA